MLNLCRVEPRRSQDFQQLATASAFFGFCIAFKKSRTGVEGSAADDERRCLRVHGGKARRGDRAPLGARWCAGRERTDDGRGPV